MQADVDACGEPEAVDEGADTAPSKRLAAHVPGYLKASTEVLAILDRD